MQTKTITEMRIYETVKFVFRMKWDISFSRKWSFDNKKEGKKGAIFLPLFAFTFRTGLLKVK